MTDWNQRGATDRQALQGNAAWRRVITQIGRPSMRAFRGRFGIEKRAFF